MVSSPVDRNAIFDRVNKGINEKGELVSNVIQLPVKPHERKAPSDKRKVQLWVRIKPSERDALQELATKSNMSTADFMRSIVGFVIEEEWRLGPTKQVEAI